MNLTELRKLIQDGESLTVEFKSDRDPLSDDDLMEAVICLANHRGGTLIIGVEDDGTITGLHPKHQTTPGSLAGFIASRTVPPISVDASFLDAPEGKVTVIRVPATRQLVSTSDGKVSIRYEDARAKPGCRPLYPHEWMNWRAERGVVDFSALPVSGSSWQDLDLLEFTRLRQMVEENRGDNALLSLSDQEIARALGFIVEDAGHLTPTITGLLMVGKEAVLHHFLPVHEVAFQVLHGLDVAVNDFHRWPLLRIHEWVMQAIGVRNEEQELMAGAVRVGVPRYDRRGLRETIHNALIHRDYTHLGAVHIQLHDDHVMVSNPGGFVAGVNPANLLAAMPRPRNPLLANAFKRVGLVERTGRGVSLIYLGQLQNGRRPPDYTRSTEANVAVNLDSGPADLDFVQMTLRANREMGRALRMEELAAFWLAWKQTSARVVVLDELIQQASGEILDSLARRRFIQVNGGVYRIDANWYEMPKDTTKPLGAPEDLILAYLVEHGRITRSQAADICKISQVQASYILKRLVEERRLQLIGMGRYAYYTLND